MAIVMVYKSGETIPFVVLRVTSINYRDRALSLQYEDIEVLVSDYSHFHVCRDENASYESYEQLIDRCTRLSNG